MALSRARARTAGSAQMPSPNAKQDLGLLLLSTTGAFGVWSATNTSLTGHMKFGLENPRIARRSMNLGIAFITAISAGLLALYGRKAVAASVGTLATGIILYGIYLWPLREDAKNSAALATHREAAGLSGIRDLLLPIAILLPGVPPF